MGITSNVNDTKTETQTYFIENKEKTLRVSYDRDTYTIEYMN
jgi:hypothetical protein